MITLSLSGSVDLDLLWVTWVEMDLDKDGVEDLALCIGFGAAQFFR